MVTAVPTWDVWFAMAPKFTVLVTVHEKPAEPLKWALSVAVTVTAVVPAVVGVPVMAPVAWSMDTPACRPVAVQEVTVAVGDESVPVGSIGVIGLPDTVLRSPVPVTVTVSVTVQVNVVVPVEPESSVAVTVTG